MRDKADKIDMNKLRNRKVNLKNALKVLFSIAILLVFGSESFAAGNNNFSLANDILHPYVRLDTTILPIPADTTVSDSLRQNNIDSISLSKDSLNAPIEYSAKDSFVFLVPQKQ